MKVTLLLLAFSLNSVAADPDSTVQMLTKASRLGDVKTAETLLSAGVTPNAPNQQGLTPLCYAALFDHIDVAALLLGHNADPNGHRSGGTSEDEFPQTPLQIAASMGNLRMASLLITAGARLDAQAKAGLTALHFAVLGSHLDMVQYLIEKGAHVNARDLDGASPLDDAVWRGNLGAIAILLANGALLNEAEAKTGATPINEAAYRGKTQIVRYLLQFSPNLKVADKRGYAPVQNAIRVGNQDAALLLLEAQATDQEGPKSLGKLMSDAITKDESAVIEALLRRGANANDLLPSGATPLDAAASSTALKTVQALLRRGADPNKTGRNGTSPLEDASVRGLQSIAEALLDHGALIDQVNSGSGTTALYAAASFGKGDIVTLLLQRGADVNLCGNGKTTSYKAALENGYPAIAAQIQRRGGSKICKPQ